MRTPSTASRRESCVNPEPDADRPNIPTEVLGVRVEEDSGTPVMLLREVADPHRVLPIFIGGPEAIAIAMGLQGLHGERPLTHDLFAHVLTSTDVALDDATVTGLREGTFLAELHIRSPLGARTISCRPSDAVALAVRLGAPVFVDRTVMDVAGTIPSDEIAEMLTDNADHFDDSEIAAAVDEFRSFLDVITPEDFGGDAPGA